MRRFTLYSFVISLLWLGFICAISFMEAPLKFKAPGVDMKQAVSIGRVVFHALNRTEWICCAFSWLLMMRIRTVRERGSMVMLGLVTALLLFQTYVLFPALDQRAALVLMGETSPPDWHHMAYIVAEVLKAITLGLLSAAQIQAFARAVISE
jgi:Domain of unknown function (DUF4149)